VYDKAPEEPTTIYGQWRTRTGDIHSPKVPLLEPLRLECRHFLNLVAGEGEPLRAARDGLLVVRALEQLQASLATVTACRVGIGIPRSGPGRAPPGSPCRDTH